MTRPEGERVVIRGRSGWWITGALAALCLYLLVDAAVRGAWTTVLVSLPWLAAVVSACWALLVRPCVVVTPEGLLVVNIARTHLVPWAEIDELHVRYQLLVTRTDGRRLQAWGSPTTERSRRVTRTDAKGGAAKPFVEVVEVIEQARDEVGTVAAEAWTRFSWEPLALAAGCVALGVLAALVL